MHTRVRDTLTMSEPAGPQPTPSAAREEAVARIKKRRDFKAHLLTFVVVNAALWILWAVTGAGYPWPAWITGFWSIGLIMNAWEVYFRRPISEAEIEAEMRKGGAGQ